MQMLSVAKIGKCWCKKGQMLSVAKIGKRQFVKSSAAKIDKCYGSQNWQMLSVAKIGKCCLFPKLASIISCQNWQMSLSKIGKYQLPKLANVVGWQNWQMLSVAKIGKCCRLPKLANVIGCQKLANFEDTEVAKIGKCRLPKLANVGCQIWQLLKTPKVAFEHTCAKW